MVLSTVFHAKIAMLNILVKRDELFGTRQDEHERAVRLKKSGNSALAKHVHDEDHSVAWKKSMILCKENRWAQRKWKEACFIEQSNNGIANRDNGMTLPEVYKPIVRN